MTTPSHETLREQLLDLAYGELSRRQAAALRRHLEGCAACRGELARMEGTRALMSGLSDAPAPEGGERVLLAAAREAAESRRPRRRLAWLWGAPAGALAAIVIALVSYRLYSLAPRPLAESADGQAYAPPPPSAAARDQGEERDEAPTVAGATASQDLADAREAKPAQADLPASPGAHREFQGKKAAPAPRLGAAGDAGAAGSLGPSRRQRAAAPESPDAVAQGGEQGMRRKGEEAAKDKASALELGAAATGKVARADELTSSPEEARADDARPLPAAAPRKPRPPSVARAEAPAAGADAQPEKEAKAVASLAAERRSVAAAKEPAEPLARERAEAAAESASPRAAPAPAALAAAPAGREDAIARHHRLQVAGRLRVSTATFAGCAGESFREVALDEAGRVVRHVRRGKRGGAPYEAQLFYGEDGALGAVRYEEGGRVREARFDPAAGPPRAEGIPPAALEPRRAADAGLGAPARCEE